MRHLLLALLATATSWGTQAQSVTTSHSLVHDGRERSYLVTRPDSCQRNCPVVFDLHGYNNTPAGQQATSGLDAKGEANGYITVYPAGIGNSWNAGQGARGCCGDAQAQNIDDVGFLRAVAAAVQADYPVNGRRLYLSGWSNGCALAQRASVEASDVFAATACTGFYLLTRPKALPRPISVTEIHALGDAVVPYRATPLWPGAQGNRQRWTSLNGCTDAPQRSQLTAASYVDTHSACVGGRSVRLVSLGRSDHNTYANSDGVDVAQLIWDAVRTERLR